MKNLLAAIALVGAGMSASGALASVAAYANADVNLRAGPGTGYPVVRVIPVGAPVANHGCLADYSWCDIGYAGTRGWVSARYVTVAVGGANVVLTAPVAARAGLPVVAYGPAYWNAYYRAYPWYRNGPAYYRAAPCRFGCTVNRTVTGPRGGAWSGSTTIDR